MGHKYRRNVHASINTNLLSVIEWKVKTYFLYYKNITFDMVDSVRDYDYILMTTALDFSDTKVKYLQMPMPFLQSS